MRILDNIPVEGLLVLLDAAKKEHAELKDKCDQINKSLSGQIRKCDDQYYYIMELEKKLRDIAEVKREIAVLPSISKDLVRFNITTTEYIGDKVIKTYIDNTVEYYRFNGILLFRYGGEMVLKTPQKCSDEDWERMLKGDIPERFFQEDPEIVRIRAI